MSIRVPMSGSLRLKMIVYGTATTVGCLWAEPYVTTDAAATFLGVGVLMGIVAVLGGIVGVQDL